MGFTEVLTIVFIILKLLGVISWAWLLVLLPEIIAAVIYIILIILYIIAVSKTCKRAQHFWDDL